MSDPSDDTSVGDATDQVPDTSDGFDEVSEDTKRRNLITAAIIVVCVVIWVLYGLRHALF